MVLHHDPNDARFSAEDIISDKLVAMSGVGDEPARLSSSGVCPIALCANAGGGGGVGLADSQDSSDSVTARRSRTVFVSNLDYKVDEQFLNLLFEKV